MQLTDIIYNYDSSVTDKKLTSGKYLLMLSARGRTKHNVKENDLRTGVRVLFNQVCFDYRKTQLFLSLYIGPFGEIEIKSKDLLDIYVFKAALRNMNIEELVSLLKD